MPKTTLGTTSSPIDYPNYPEKVRDGNGNWKVVEKYWIAVADVATSLPAHNATKNQHGVTVTDPGGTTLRCKEAEIRSKDGTPGIAEVTLTYYDNSVKMSLKSAKDNPRSFTIRGQDIPIDDERLLTANGGPYSQAQIDDAKENGYRSLMQYGAEYMRQETNDSYTWSEANLKSNLQATGAPTGITSATAANWRVIGRDIEEMSGTTVIRTRWEYSPSGFVPIST